jgi:tyrosine-specific transport protein
MSLSIVRTPSLLGGILLVVGNVIGAGILALPIATAALGLPMALLVLVLFWFLMLIGAFYFLEANLNLPVGSNLVSMARASLGRWGAGVAWTCNLFVMYSLIAAYIAGGGELIHLNLQRLGVIVTSSCGSLLFLLIFGGIVTLGIARIDYANRFLMLFKAIIFILFVFGLIPHLGLSHAQLLPSSQFSSSLLIIVVTSYGFATIVPSLRSYYQSDVEKIKLIMVWGMVIALICYVVWVTLIFCVIPFQGEYGLQAMAASTHPVSDLQSALSEALQIPWITQGFNGFSSICIMTSFLANSISLTDFIADGFHFYKKRGKSILVYTLAYAPPLAAVLFYPRAFLVGLSFAGILAIILLLVLPALMVLRFRNRSGKQQTRASQALAYGVLLFSIVILIGSIGGHFYE